MLGVSTIEVEIESSYAPSSREEWMVARAIEKAALRARLPKGAMVSMVCFPVTKPITLLSFKVDERDETPSGIPPDKDEAL